MFRSLCHLLEVFLFGVLALYITVIVSLYSFAPPIYCTAVCRTGCRQTVAEWENKQACEAACHDICYNETRR